MFDAGLLASFMHGLGISRKDFPPKRILFQVVADRVSTFSLLSWKDYRWILKLVLQGAIECCKPDMWVIVWYVVTF